MLNGLTTIIPPSGAIVPHMDKLITLRSEAMLAFIHPYPVPDPMKVMSEMAGKKIDKNIFECIHDILNSYISY